MIKELKNPITDNYKNLKKEIFSEDMPWYYYEKTVSELETQDIPFFSHMLLRRPLEEMDGMPAPLISIPTSKYFEKCYHVLKEILDYNEVYFDVVYRMNLNLTLNNSIKESIPHTDFCLPHKVVIIYLSEFSDGRTVVLDEKNKKYYSNPSLDQGIIFDGKYKHFHECPLINEKRVVLVANIE